MKSMATLAVSALMCLILTVPPADAEGRVNASGATTDADGAVAAGSDAIAAAPSPPIQPSHGPGGADYAHAEVIAREVHPGAQGWWLFTPAAPVPTAGTPVVVFCHGWGALDPKGYRAWIDHIVRRGNIVIFPNYQDSLFTPGTQFLPNAIAGVRGALADLASGTDGVSADTNRMAVVGHSAGGVLSAEIATVAQAEGLPAFRAAMPVEPGDGSRDGRRRASVPMVDLQSMPPATLLLIVVGADDHLAYEKLGLHIYDAAARIPAANKNVIELESDRHGAPALIANHSAPAGTLDSHPANARRALFPDFEHAGVVDALDWYGTWKLFDALSDAAFYGREREMALGGSAAQLSMGAWSDGVPVKPMRVLR
ncbi:MAG: alpha/beta hydrolase [Rudaea sp.]|nr:alpha/beta hydrolase [Rudaea sp.]